MNTSKTRAETWELRLETNNWKKCIKHKQNQKQTENKTKQKKSIIAKQPLDNMLKILT